MCAPPRSNCNALLQVHDLAYEDLEKIRSDIESGAVRQDSLETLIALLTKHTDQVNFNPDPRRNPNLIVALLTRSEQRFVKVAKEMKKQVCLCVCARALQHAV